MSDKTWYPGCATGRLLSAPQYLVCIQWLLPRPKLLLPSITSRFPDTRLLKIGSVLNDVRQTLWTLNCQCAHWIPIPKAPILLYNQPFFETPSCGKFEMDRMSSDWPWILICDKYPVHTEYLPPKPKFSSVLLYDQPFSRYKVVENWKCTEWPQIDIEHVTVKNTLYTPKSCPRSQILLCFAPLYNQRLLTKKGKKKKKKNSKFQ